MSFFCLLYNTILYIKNYRSLPSDPAVVKTAVITLVEFLENVIDKNAETVSKVKYLLQALMFQILIERKYNFNEDSKEFSQNRTNIVTESCTALLLHLTNERFRFKTAISMCCIVSDMALNKCRALFTVQNRLLHLLRLNIAKVDLLFASTCANCINFTDERFAVDYNDVVRVLKKSKYYANSPFTSKKSIDSLQPDWNKSFSLPTLHEILSSLRKIHHILSTSKELVHIGETCRLPSVLLTIISRMLMLEQSNYCPSNDENNTSRLFEFSNNRNSHFCRSGSTTQLFTSYAQQNSLYEGALTQQEAINKIEKEQYLDLSRSIRIYAMKCLAKLALGVSAYSWPSIGHIWVLLLHVISSHLGSLCTHLSNSKSHTRKRSSSKLSGQASNHSQHKTNKSVVIDEKDDEDLLSDSEPLIDKISESSSLNSESETSDKNGDRLSGDEIDNDSEERNDDHQSHWRSLDKKEVNKKTDITNAMSHSQIKNETYLMMRVVQNIVSSCPLAASIIPTDIIRHITTQLRIAIRRRHLKHVIRCLSTVFAILRPLCETESMLLQEQLVQINRNKEKKRTVVDEGASNQKPTSDRDCDLNQLLDQVTLDRKQTQALIMSFLQDVNTFGTNRRNSVHMILIEVLQCAEHSMASMASLISGVSANTMSNAAAAETVHSLMTNLISTCIWLSPNLSNALISHDSIHLSWHHLVKLALRHLQMGVLNVRQRTSATQFNFSVENNEFSFPPPNRDAQIQAVPYLRLLLLLHIVDKSQTQLEEQVCSTESCIVDSHKLVQILQRITKEMARPSSVGLTKNPTIRNTLLRQLSNVSVNRVLNRGSSASVVPVNSEGETPHLSRLGSATGTGLFRKGSTFRGSLASSCVISLNSTISVVNPDENFELSSIIFLLFDALHALPSLVSPLKTQSRKRGTIVRTPSSFSNFARRMSEPLVSYMPNRFSTAMKPNANLVQMDDASQVYTHQRTSAREFDDQSRRSPSKMKISVGSLSSGRVSLVATLPKPYINNQVQSFRQYVLWVTSLCATPPSAPPKRKRSLRGNFSSNWKPSLVTSALSSKSDNANRFRLLSQPSSNAIFPLHKGGYHPLQIFRETDAPDDTPIRPHHPNSELWRNHPMFHYPTLLHIRQLMWPWEEYSCPMNIDYIHKLRIELKSLGLNALYGTLEEFVQTEQQERSLDAALFRENAVPPIRKHTFRQVWTQVQSSQRQLKINDANQNSSYPSQRSRDNIQQKEKYMSLYNRRKRSELGLRDINAPDMVPNTKIAIETDNQIEEAKDGKKQGKKSRKEIEDNSQNFCKSNTLLLEYGLRLIKQIGTNFDPISANPSLRYAESLVLIQMLRYIFTGLAQVLIIIAI